MTTLALTATHPVTAKQYALPFDATVNAQMLGVALADVTVAVVDSWRDGGEAVVMYPGGIQATYWFGAKKPGSGRAKVQVQGGRGKRGQAAWRRAWHGEYSDVVVERI
jgi:hypothetical protein